MECPSCNGSRFTEHSSTLIVGKIMRRCKRCNATGSFSEEQERKERSAINVLAKEVMRKRIEFERLQELTNSYENYLKRYAPPSLTYKRWAMAGHYKPISVDEAIEIATAKLKQLNDG
tara:strand:+ start:4305 stop:4658 length:354 start_codon:yes stop_codon:yes gene_type:complete